MAAAERERRTVGGDAAERILRAALPAFSELGFEGATTREIATRAGVPLGLLQYPFGGKPKLWRAAVDRAFAELREGLEGILRDPQATDERARQIFFDGETPDFQVIVPGFGTIEGPFLITSIEYAGSHNGEATYELSLASAGALNSKRPLRRYQDKENG